MCVLFPVRVGALLLRPLCSKDTRVWLLFCLMPRQRTTRKLISHIYSANMSVNLLVILHDVIIRGGFPMGEPPSYIVDAAVHDGQQSSRRSIPGSVRRFEVKWELGR